MDTSVIEMGCGSLLKIIHVAFEDTADELSELNVTEEAVDCLIFVDHLALPQIDQHIIDKRSALPRFVCRTLVILFESNNQLKDEILLSGSFASCSL